MNAAAPTTPDREHSFRKIADALRDEIVSGRYLPGERFPSTADLAGRCHASVSTVHKALVGLTKEGWLERVNGAGTFVSAQRRPFTCAGIYQGMDMSSNEHPAFYRNLHTALLAALKRRGKSVEVFVDTRSIEEQVELLPALKKAMMQHSIQGLLAPTICDASRPTFQRLNLPMAFLDRNFQQHVLFDEAEFLRSSLQRLKDDGARSVGMLITESWREAGLFALFRQAAANAGLAIRDEWIRCPQLPIIESNSDEFGYAEFLRFWKLTDKPDGLIVYPDSFMRGVISAILELGWRDVTSNLKLILHRNAHTQYLCPFPALWAVTNEDSWAEAMVQMVEDQYEGRVVAPVSLPFEFRENVLPSVNAGLVVSA